jgi:hypothetical protein
MDKRETTAEIQDQTSTRTSDPGNVRIGGMSPSFPSIRKPGLQVLDEGKVRLGGMTRAL